MFVKLKTKLKTTVTFVAVVAVVCVPSAVAQSVIYVNHTATGANDGSSWENAFVFLQDALLIAQSGDDVWVSAGTYRPDQGADVTQGDLEASFAIPSGVALYGGFVGVEKDVADRDWTINRTILSGDLNRDDFGEISAEAPSRIDNSRHVVWIEDNEARVTLDGFLIQDGHAYVDNGVNHVGGGVVVAGIATLSNLILRDNYAGRGGGANLVYPARDVILVDLLFEKNVAGESGGGLEIGSATIGVSGIVFRENRARYNGGGMRLSASSWQIATTQIWNVDFEGNFALEGGALYVEEESNLELLNGFFVNNSAGVGGGIYFEDASNAHASIVNTVLVLNQAISGLNYGAGGGIFSPGTDLDIINCTLVGNVARESGGGLYHDSQLTRLLQISNSIIWGNSALDGANVLVRPASPGELEPIIRSSIIEGGLPQNTIGEGIIIDDDPDFVSRYYGPDGRLGTLDDDFRVKSTSPAIDAGDNSSLPNDLFDADGDGNFGELLPVDILGNIRVFDGGSGTATADMGAFEFGASAIGTAAEPVTITRDDQPVLLRAYPNPFHSATTITYNLPKTANVRLELFNVLGRRVRAIRNDMTASGRHTAILSADGLSSGPYFYRLTAGRYLLTGKVIVTK